tara:strand:+ start:1788 stop:2786 length:999 start_codon:yes stop_codon:yes gene_type:complete
MATAPKDIGQQVAVILSLCPDDVLIGERLGAFWPDKAAALGKLMAEDGQNDPIKVRKSGPRAAKPWTLVAGLHRLEGAKIENLRIIDAIEVVGDETTLRRIEASENVERGSRSPIERACFVRAIADAAEQRLAGQHGGLSQQQIAIRARWDALKVKAAGIARDDEIAEAEGDYTADILSGVYGWEESVAESLGMTSRTIRRDLALHRAIVAPFPHLYRDLATHPVVGENASALRDIAVVRDEGVRRHVIEALIANPAMTVLQAKVKVGIRDDAAPAKSGATKYIDNASANIRRLSAEQQKSWASSFAEDIKPSALEAFRDALDARIKAEAGA